MTFGPHANNICRACYFHLLGLRRVRSAESTDTAKSSHALQSVSDSTNGMRYSPACQHATWTNQRVQNTIARVVTGLRRRDHITQALKELHWLPIRARITFNVETVVYRLRERRQPPYLADLISDYVSMRTLRSSTMTLLAEPSLRTNIGRRSFRYVAAKTWNNLPDDMKIVDGLG